MHSAELFSQLITLSRLAKTVERDARVFSELACMLLGANEPHTPPNLIFINMHSVQNLLYE